MTLDLKKLTIKKAHDHLRRGDFSARELTERYLKEVEDSNANLNAYLEVFGDAIDMAKDADKVLGEKKEDADILTGIPLAVKDNILIQGHTASCGGRMLENYRAAYDATVIAKLKEKRAVFLGRTNMDEFAMGSSTEYSAYGPTKNPHDLSRAPGGSSGGSAAAVSAGLSLAALGSDTGGSIRQPASFCGVVGLKPTYGRVSRYGLVALASSLDQIGPFGRSVEDAKIIFEAIAGHDRMDSTSLPVDYQHTHRHTLTNAEDKEVRTIGVPYHFLEEEGIDNTVKENFKNAVRKLESGGYAIKEITLTSTQYALPIYYIILPAEASANLARFDGVRYGLHVSGNDLFEDYAKTRGVGFGKEVRRRILLGTHVLSSGYYDAYYAKAKALRALIRRDFHDAFGGVDVIATPTSPTPAFSLGEKTKDPVSMYLSDIFTVPANIAGLPAISVPSGFTQKDGTKLPLGIQFIAPYLREDALFDIGAAFEALNTA